MPAIYADFDLLILAHAGQYLARVLDSPAGQASTAFAVPFPEENLQQFWRHAGRVQRHIAAAASPEEEATQLDPKVFGTRLYEGVFSGQVGQVFLRSLDEAQRTGKGLRIRLRLTEVPELANLPWEFLYAPDLGRFLAPSDATPIVRYSELAQPVRPFAVTPPLRVLAIVSDPTDAQKLNVEQEWQRLQEALRDLQAQGLVRLERLEGATPAFLQQRLRRGEVHVLHFIGHGFFHAQRNEGALVFEDEAGRSLTLSAEQLATLLHDHLALRLVFLNACEGARGGATLPFAGVAQKLVQQTVPAVLAMQFEVGDAAAIALASEFYRALADGVPVDSATGEARKALFVAGEAYEWGTPVLYSRAPDGMILDIAKEKSTKEKEESMQAPDEQPWWNQIKAQGDVIIATIGAGSSGVVVGKNITQQIYQLVGPPTPDDKQIVAQQLAELEAALAGQQGGMDAAKQQVAELQLQLLRGELSKTEEGEMPSAGAITLAGNWLLDNVPSIAEALAGVFVTPAVARVVGKAGEAAVTWARTRLNIG